MLANTPLVYPIFQGGKKKKDDIFIIWNPLYRRK